MQVKLVVDSGTGEYNFRETPVIGKNTEITTDVFADSSCEIEFRIKYIVNGEKEYQTDHANIVNGRCRPVYD